MQEFFGAMKVIFAAGIAAGVAGFFIAVSFWWGTYFSIKMILDLLAGACS